MIHPSPRHAAKPARPIDDMWLYFAMNCGAVAGRPIACGAAKMAFPIVNNNENTMAAADGGAIGKRRTRWDRWEKRRRALQHEQCKRWPESIRKQSNNNPEQNPVEPRPAPPGGRLASTRRTSLQIVADSSPWAMMPGGGNPARGSCQNLQIVADSMIAAAAGQRLHCKSLQISADSAFAVIEDRPPFLDSPRGGRYKSVPSGPPPIRRDRKSVV